mgnify:CR=1 FL=1
MSGKLFIIDLMPFLYKGHFVFLRHPRMTATGINTSALLGFANGIQGILKKEKPTHVVLAMDPVGPTFRHEAYAPYKAQRQKMPEELAAQLPYIKKIIQYMGITILEKDGGDEFIVTSGLSGGEEIVAEGAGMVKEGQDVKKLGQAQEQPQNTENK